MMIAEVNVAIGAVDRILKMTKDGKSNNRELTNARAELDHWRARLLKAVHKGTPNTLNTARFWFATARGR
jgi:hypothetical protein